VGDGGVGKSAFVQRFITGEFEEKYMTTAAAVQHSITQSTPRGVVKFNVWDTAGCEKCGKLRDAYYIGSHCAIIMFDVTSLMTITNVGKWYADLTRVCGRNIPIALLGNKFDDQRDVFLMKSKGKMINALHRNYGLECWLMSVKSNRDIDKPLLCLAQWLLGDKTFHPNNPVAQAVLQPLPCDEEYDL
jgi:GTP-binding nuclear protein Ran